MANTLEYVLSLQDQMSTKLQRIGISSDGALSKFAKLQKQAGETSKLINDMGTSIGSLRQKLDHLKSEKEWIPSNQIKNISLYNREIGNLERHIQRLENSGAGKLKTWFSDAFSQVPFSGLLTNPLVIAGALAGKAIKVGVEDEMQRTSFEVLLGGKAAAERLVNDIKQYADKTPFEKLGLGDAAKTMLGFGIAQESVMPNLKMLGDIAMGDANKLSSLTLAFSQISSAGKLQGQDLLQLINAGFNPLQEISKRTGQSMAELRKEMEGGNVSFDMVRQAFVDATAEGGKFHGMSDKMSQTVGGKWSSAMDKINETFLKLYNIISPVIIPVIDILTSSIDFLVGSLSWLFNGLAEGNVYLWAAVSVFTALGLLVKWNTIMFRLQYYWILLTSKLGGMWTSFVSGLKSTQVGLKIVTAAQWLWNAALNANPIGLIIGAVIALSAAVYGLYKLMTGMSTEEKLNAEVKQRVIDKTVDQRVEMDLLFNTLKNAKKGSDEYNQTLRELEAMQPGIVEKYNLQAGALKDINSAHKEMVYNIEKVAEAEARKELLKEAYKEALTQKNEGPGFMDQVLGAGSYLGGGMSAEQFNNLDVMAAKNKANILARQIAKDKEKVDNIQKNLGKDNGLGLNDPGALTGKNKTAKTTGKKTNEAIATGGQKNVTNNFTFRNMIENMPINKAGFKESVGEMQRLVEDTMLRILAMADSTAG